MNIKNKIKYFQNLVIKTNPNPFFKFQIEFDVLIYYSIFSRVFLKRIFSTVVINTIILSVKVVDHSDLPFLFTNSMEFFMLFISIYLYKHA